MQSNPDRQKAFLAKAVRASARVNPPEASVGFSQGPLTLTELAEDIKSGGPRGEQFFDIFQAQCEAQGKPFVEAARALTKKPSVYPTPRSRPGAA